MSEENRSHRIKITNIPEGNLLFQKDDRTWEPIIISGTIFLFFGLSSVKILALPFGLATIWQLIKKPDKLFSGYDVICAHPYRIMRNAELGIDEEDAADLLQEIRKQLKKRQTSCRCTRLSLRR